MAVLAHQTYDCCHNIKKQNETTLRTDMVVVKYLWDQIKEVFLFLERNYGSLSLSLCPYLLFAFLHFSLLNASLKPLNP